MIGFYFKSFFLFNETRISVSVPLQYVTDTSLFFFVASFQISRLWLNQYHLYIDVH